jgi:hypothetical protein
MADKLDDWLAGLPDDDASYKDEVAGWDAKQRKKAIQLMATLKQFGCKNPGEWAFSEVSENTPQTATFAFLKGITRILEYGSKAGLDHIIDQFAEHPTLAKSVSHLNKTLPQAEREALIAAIGKYFASEIVNMIDQGCSSDLPDIDMLWSLQEANDDGLTGRELGGLHESDDGDDDQDFVPQSLKA